MIYLIYVNQAVFSNHNKEEVMFKEWFLGSAVSYYSSWEFWRGKVKSFVAFVILVAAIAIILAAIPSDVLKFISNGSLRAITIILVVAVAAALAVRKLL